MKRNQVVVIERRGVESENRWQLEGVRYTWREAKQFAKQENQRRGGEWRIRKFEYAGREKGESRPKRYMVAHKSKTF